MKIPKPSIPAVKVDTATLQKVGYTAVGLGSALLIATDPKLQRQLKGELGNLINKLKTEASSLQDRLPSISSPAATKPAPQGNKGTSTGEAIAGIVYLLKAGPFFKIGKTVDFEKRLGQIKLQLPYSVEVVHKIQAANLSHVENYWHRRFASRRQNGEWFVLTDVDVAEFKSFSKM